jgi:hypothetical protein
MRMFAIATMLLGLTACEPSDGAAKERNIVEIVSVRDSEISTDGSTNIVKRGKFVIGTGTSICRVKADIVPSLKEIAPAFYGPGISGVNNGYLNESLDGNICSDDGVNIVSHWQLIFNRSGEPYKLTLVMRQGGTFWQGTVERVDSKYPLFSDTKWLGDRGVVSRSLLYDVEIISKKFSDSLVR